MHLLKTITLLTLAGLGTSCTTTGGVRQSTGVETVANEKALAFPPPGGPAILNVIESRHKDDLEQTVSFATSSSVPGQNFLKIKFLTASGANPGLGSTPYGSISENVIARETIAAIPGVTLARSATFVQNGYGPFGYASGQSHSGDTCLYAWQQIRAGRSTQAQLQNFSMVQVRFRLCDAHASERQLLGAVYGYTIAGGFVNEALNPYGTVRGADAVLARAGDPIYPDPGNYRSGGTPIGYEAAPVADRIVVVRQPVAIPHVVAGTPLPQPIGPHVPLPDEHGQPQTSVVAAPIKTTGEPPPETAKTFNTIVPSPDCVSDTVSPACQK